MKIHSISHEAFQALNDPNLDLRESSDVPFVLHELVHKIAQIMHADVCSLYLYDSDIRSLTLKATYGLNEELLDKLRLQVGEGLVGMTLKHQKPITVTNVRKSRNYKEIPELGESGLTSLLAVPLIYNNQPIGVLSVQTKLKRTFRKRDIQLLMSLAIPAVNMIEKAKFLGALGTVTSTVESTEETTIEFLKDHHIKGLAASPGIAMGFYKKVSHKQAKRRVHTGKQGISSEVERLKEAFLSVKEEIQRTRSQAETKFGPDEVSIFDAYLLFLESKSFQEQIIHEIENGLSSVKALQIVVSKYMDRISQGADEYIKERAYDIQDVAQKITNHLLYGESHDEEKFLIEKNTIFCSDTWSISDFVHFDTQQTKGIISPEGGASSHIAILAESLNLPAVLGIGASALQIQENDYIIVDGYHGIVIVNPSDETIKLYESQIHTQEKIKKSYLKGREQKLRLKRNDTYEIFRIGANIEMVGHVHNALKAGADEIGLFRTEFPYLVRNNLPTEDEQYQLYRQVLKMMKKKPVTFRTLDIGGDKYLSYLDLPEETNPSLGWRSIRFSLERKDLFRIQLRALLKASPFGKMRILFPMVSTMEQIFEIEDTLSSVKKELQEEGLKVASKIPIGYMIEIPAAVEIADKIARHSDYLSIGTNDLIQYCLAADRTNPKVAKLYDPYHPAVLRMIHRTVRAAHKERKSVTICGDMAAQPLLIPVLWALGVDSLSMNPNSIPRIKYLMRHFDFGVTKSMAYRTLNMDSGHEIKELLSDYFKKHSLSEYLTRTLPEG